MPFSASPELRLIGGGTVCGGGSAIPRPHVEHLAKFPTMVAGPLHQGHRISGITHLAGSIFRSARPKIAASERYFTSKSRVCQMYLSREAGWVAISGPSRVPLGGPPASGKRVQATIPHGPQASFWQEVAPEKRLFCRSARQAEIFQPWQFLRQSAASREGVLKQASPSVQ